MTTDEVTIRLFGRFAVTVNGTTTPTGAWVRRSAAALVKALALAPGNRLHREQVIDLLWPEDSLIEAAPKLRKAAHYARKAAGPDAVVLLGDVLALFPSAALTIDVTCFDELSRRATADDDPQLARRAILAYTGELLPEDLYVDWVAERRELLRLRQLHLLRIAGRWVELSELDPTAEDAHLALMHEHVARGDHHAALVQYGRLERVLEDRLGVSPGPAARQLRAALDVTSARHEAVSTIVTRDGLAGGGDGAGTVDELVAELAELARRRTMLLEALADATAAASAGRAGAPAPCGV